jgi:hypothetical protein
LKYVPSKGLIPRAAFLGETRKFSHEIIVRMRHKGLIPRAIFLGEMRKFSREIIVRMRHKSK